MMSDPREAELLSKIEERDERIASLLEEKGRLLKERQILQERIDQLLRKIYGGKSERADMYQLQLLMQEMNAPGPALGKGSDPEAIEIEPREGKRISRKKSGPRLPEHLPVVEEILVPEAVQAAPEAWRRIGEEVSERLDFEPARFFKRRLVRPKYVRRGEVDAIPVIAKLPPPILEGSILTAGLLAQVLVAKYCDHLPLYRQESIYRTRHGVELSRQLMAQWVGVAANWLGLMYEEMRSEVMANGYIQVDETPIRYLAPGHGKTRTGFFWAMHCPTGDVIFDWQTSRATECLDKIIPAEFCGKIQCDGYAAYQAFARRHAGRIKRVGCLTHCRRKFVEAADHAPRDVRLVLHLMRNLYRLEEHLREIRASPKLRAMARNREARPVMERLHRLLLTWKRKQTYLPQSAMGKAIDYALEQWSCLVLYLDDGRLEIDTNLVENAIRPTAVGKKNWLFIGEANAGDRSAIIYTVIESCRRRGIDPYEYLRDIFTRLPCATNQQIAQLTPEGWAKARPAATLRRAA